MVHPMAFRSVTVLRLLDPWKRVRRINNEPQDGMRAVLLLLSSCGGPCPCVLVAIVSRRACWSRRLRWHAPLSTSSPRCSADDAERCSDKRDEMRRNNRDEGNADREEGRRKQHAGIGHTATDSHSAKNQQKEQLETVAHAPSCCIWPTLACRTTLSSQSPTSRGQRLRQSKR